MLVVLGGLAVAVAVLFLTGKLGTTTVSAEELDRVLLVAASPDEEGEVVGQIIAVLEVGDGSVSAEAVSPALDVAIPGTSFSTLADAYPFGGGAGTADAYARVTDEQLPYVALTPEQLSAAVEAVGGVRVDLPAPMSVFDGEQLYSLKEGIQTLGGAELRAVFKGAPYLTAAQRGKLDAELVEALIGSLGKAEVLALPGLDTNLDDEALSELKRAFGNANTVS